MSRIGKLPISIPAGVTVSMKDGIVTVKGPKGELSQKVDSSIKTIIEDGQITFEVDENNPVNYKQKQAFHGLYRSLVNNMVVKDIRKQWNSWVWVIVFLIKGI